MITDKVKNIFLAILSIIFAVALVELILRLTPYKNFKKFDSPFGITKGYYYNSEDLGHDITKNFEGGTHSHIDFNYPIFSNKYGCFDYTKNVDEAYILALGDSFTWGFAPLKKKWTTHIEQRLEKTVLKCGISSYGTRQQLYKGKKILEQVKKAPDLIILMYYTNDMVDDLYFMNRHKGEISNINLRTGKIDFVKRLHSTYADKRTLKMDVDKGVYELVKHYLKKLRYELVMYNIYIKKIKPTLRALKYKVLYKNYMPENIKSLYYLNMFNYLDSVNEIKWYKDMIDYHKDGLHSFIDYAEQIGTSIFLVDINGDLDHEMFSDITNNESVHYYNLKKDYPNPSKWKNDGHWDVEGNQKIGQLIYRELIKQGI